MTKLAALRLWRGPLRITNFTRRERTSISKDPIRPAGSIQILETACNNETTHGLFWQARAFAYNKFYAARTYKYFNRDPIRPQEVCVEFTPGVAPASRRHSVTLAPNTLFIIHDTVQPYLLPIRNLCALTPFQQLILSLIKLRLNLSLKDLSYSLPPRNIHTQLNNLEELRNMDDSCKLSVQKKVLANFCAILSCAGNNYLELLFCAIVYESYQVLLIAILRRVGYAHVWVCGVCLGIVWLLVHTRSARLSIRARARVYDTHRKRGRGDERASYILACDVRADIHALAYMYVCGIVLAMQQQQQQQLLHNPRPIRNSWRSPLTLGNALSAPRPPSGQSANRGRREARRKKKMTNTYPYEYRRVLATNDDTPRVPHVIRDSRVHLFFSSYTPFARDSPIKEIALNSEKSVLVHLWHRNLTVSMWVAFRVVTSFAQVTSHCRGYKYEFLEISHRCTFRRELWRIFFVLTHCTVQYTLPQEKSAAYIIRVRRQRRIRAVHACVAPTNSAASA
ncbi:unnamed protein product [Trichogramma brassicae]|uniref:Uncharacterized protein n=1 Tax=Trichogramma brassicae TaxID=86971 RepID=A0A6H5IY51_9HYME|nr:unnamed protein product [Trichogramma brassicae]